VTAGQGGVRTVIEVGWLRLLGLSDGEFTMPPDFLSSPEAHHSLAGPDGQVHLPVGCFLLPGDEPVLIDIGFGPRPPTSLLSGGELLSQLAAAGYRPQDITTIALTHPHPDHVGWLASPDGTRTFPRARLLLSAADYQYFIRERQGEMEEHIRLALASLHETGRAELITGEYAISRHVTALMAPGHTPGHTVFAVHDHGERALVLGDALYCPQQLGHTDWAALSDVDPALAARTRIALERDLASAGGVAVGAHFPGLIASRVLASNQDTG
jgi:glyoxylase-like metal-dependent hydrolase (beta-lactamase superfamily II)